MFYLILLLILGLLISPILYLKPSPRQKRQVVLRTKAHSLGLQVKMAPLPTRESGSDERSTANSMAYRLLRPKESKRLPVSYETGRSVSDASEWFFFKPEKRPPILLVEAIMPLLKQLPSSVKAVESNRDYVGIFWHESGSEEDIELIAQILSQIHQQEVAFFTED